ncbi:MAG: hypothetical protein KGZ80_00415 [Methylomonas sp.]|nr:hypothetical protein [Methylomonas sp.]
MRTEELDEEREKKREFRAVLDQFGITQAQAAELIANETEQPVAARKVRSWLADPETPSSRNLPNWALTALKRATQNLPPAGPQEQEK